MCNCLVVKSDKCADCTKKPNTNDFSVAKVGDSVWDNSHGGGEIISIRGLHSYPILVRFQSGSSQSYTFDGRVVDTAKYQCLYWSNPNIVAPARVEPLPELKVDQKVVVYYKGCRNKNKRHFSHFEKDGTIHVFNNGATSFSASGTSGWECYEIVED